MKPVQRGEVLGLAEYETIRERFRARVIEEKRRRRVALGPRATCLFENHDTALLQIQEMLRTERITRESAVLHEITTYNQLVPGERELSATIFVEIEDKAERDAFLAEAVGLERTFAVVIDGEKCAAVSPPDASRADANRTTAVHYVKFPLGEKAAKALREGGARAKVEIVCEHPRYPATATVTPELAASLAEDLAE